MANDNFVVKIAPTLAIKNFFNGIGLAVTGITHPHVAKYSYMIQVEEPRSLLGRLTKQTAFVAKIDLQQRSVSVKHNDSVFLTHAKNIVTSIDPLMDELGIEKGLWTINVTE